MDAVKFIDELARMCNAYNQCRGCPITDWCGQGLRAQTKYSTDIISAVEKWAAAHPVKTRQSEFLRLFPETKVDSTGCISICPCYFSAAHRDSNGSCGDPDRDCGVCRREFWMQEVE